MRTPFDTARRIEKRKVDDIRIAIRIQLGAQADLAHQDGALIDQVERETVLARENPVLSARAWLQRMEEERNRLRAEVRAVEERLVGLRSQAAEAYGAMCVLEDAARLHVETATYNASIAEQASIDDIMAARLAAIRRAIARRRRT